MLPRRFVLAALLLCSLAAAGQPRRDVSREQARTAPEWVRSGVIYEIFPREFSASGDFEGITARLGALEKLGVNVLWIMPVNPVGQVKRKGTLGSPYSVRDYCAIDPAYGAKADFKHLVEEAHRRSFKVILDVVANHTAWDSVLMKTPQFYKHDAAGRIISPVPDWADVAALDYSNPKLRRYMTEMLAYWLREFSLDGFRCDVASMVPTDFWEQARPELEKVRPDLFMLAEAHEPELMVKAFDADYAWPFYHALAGVVEDGKPAADIRAAWEQERAKFPLGTLHMRFSDNHDEKRAIARFGERGALAASALIFGMDGVPMLYNGMEAGDTTESGGAALFEKLPVFWSNAGRRPEYPRFYEAMIALRRAHPALRHGETMWVENSDPGRIVTLLRRGAGEEFIIAVNLSNRPFRGQVQASGFEPVAVAPAAKLPALELDAWGYQFFRRTN